MPKPETLSTRDLLSLLESIQRGLARSSKSEAKLLTRLADRAARINRRLHTADTKSWRAFTNNVLRRPSGDLVFNFLFGGLGFSVDSPRFLQTLQKLVVEYAEFSGGKK